MLYLARKDMALRSQTIAATSTQSYPLLVSPNSEYQAVSPVISEYSWSTCSSRRDWGQRRAKEEETEVCLFALNI